MIQEHNFLNEKVLVTIQFKSHNHEIILPAVWIACNPPSSKLLYAWTNDKAAAIAYSARDDATWSSAVTHSSHQSRPYPSSVTWQIVEFEVHQHEPSSEVGHKRPGNDLQSRAYAYALSCSIVLSYHIIYLDAMCRSLSPMTRCTVPEREEANFVLPHHYIEACVPASVCSVLSQSLRSEGGC